MVAREERDIYTCICSRDGVTAREIANLAGCDRKTVNHYLYVSPFMSDLCYRDKDYRWYGLIRQQTPHRGLEDYCGYYGLVREFLGLDEDSWLEELKEGCGRIGRSLNDTRGLFHSFRDCREVMTGLFRDLEEAGCPGYKDWEIGFELRIRTRGHVRIYADVLVIAPQTAFSLEFKMKDEADPKEVEQAAKYCEYMEVLFGPSYNVIPALVLTRAEDIYTYAPLPGTTGEVPVCSGDMLFNVFDEYLGFLGE